MANSEKSPRSSASSSLSSLQLDDGDSGNASPNDSDIFDFDAINTDDLLQVEVISYSINSPGCRFKNDPCSAYSPFVANTPGFNEHYKSPDDGYHFFLLQLSATHPRCQWKVWVALALCYLSNPTTVILPLEMIH